MKSLIILSTALLLGISSATFAGENHDRNITISVDTGQMTVPDRRIWKVEGLSPYVSETGVGTADLYVDGQVQVGTDKDYTVNGHMDILINKTQTSPLLILSGSKISVGDSRQTVVVKEYIDGQ